MKLIGKRGFIQFIFVIALIAIVGIVAVPVALNQLSIGISDDYIVYDAFERGYLDENLWASSGPNTPSVNEAGEYLSYYVASDCSSDYQSSWKWSLTTDESMAGNYFKTKFQANSYRTNDNKYGYSTVTLYLNDVEILSYGELASSYGSDAYVHTVEGIPSFESPDIYSIIVDGEDYRTVDISNPSGDGKIKYLITARVNRCGKTSAQVYYLRYKIPYNCKINDDEILIYDSFAAGSQVNISTLSRTPTKFCLDYPIKARSFDEDGIKTDIRGEILQKMVRGQTSTVPDNEEWKVYYITKYTSDIEMRCDLGEAYNTETGQCDNPSDDYIVGCLTDSDCYIPAGCTGVTATCESKECVYDGACIYQPGTEESGFWDSILSLAFFQWVAGFFS